MSHFSEFEAQARFAVDTAADWGAHLVVLPELITTQLLGLTPAQHPWEAARGLHAFTHAYREFFSAIAMSRQIAIVAGTHLQLCGEKFTNTAYLFHADGAIDQQHKLHITPSELRSYKVEPGDTLRIFRVAGCKVAILICYDSEFPELGRAAAARGAELLVVPYNTDLRSGHLRVRHCAHARAIENHVYVALAGASGTLPGLPGVDQHYAQSAIVTPSDVPFARDALAAEAPVNDECVVLADLDIGLLHRTRDAGAVCTWRDRRHDLYRVTMLDEDGGTV
jgi:predicted amidohydrolase